MRDGNLIRRRNREAKLLMFVQRCAAENPAATVPRNEAVELLEELGIEPREPGLFYTNHEAELRDAFRQLA